MACMMKVNISYAKIGRYILELEHTLTDDKWVLSGPSKINFAGFQ
jgi:hypothetical protein